MRDFAQRLAAANPATTPRDAPLTEDALALLDQVMVPRTAASATYLPPRRSRMPRLAIGILVPAILLTVLAVMIRGCSAAVPLPAGAPAATASASAAWVGFTSEDELVAASDAIVIADTVGVGEIQQNGQPYHVATVRVVSAGKGGFTSGDYLQVGFPDPTQEFGVMWPTALDPGAKVLLFLTTPGVEGADASLVNLIQGSYLITDDPAPVAAPQNPLELDSGFLERMGLKIP